MSSLDATVPLTWRGIRNRLLKMLVLIGMIGLPLVYAHGRYKIVFDNVRGADCLPYSTFIIDLRDRDVHRGDYVAFRADQMDPFYKRGTAAVKILAGIPGDRFVVDDVGIAINGKAWGELVHVTEGGKLWSMGHRVSEYVRDELIPPGSFAMMGTYERSFDSRYWGYIRDEQVIGRAIPLW